jgi:lysophospholipase L1-like esterase
MNRRALLLNATAMAAAAAIAPRRISAASAITPPAYSWRGAWGRALQQRRDPMLIPAGSTYGETLTVSLGGNALRIRISNEHGNEPLSIASAVIQPGGKAPLRLGFGGGESMLIPPGAPAVSDAIDLAVTPGMAVDVRLLLDRPTLAANYARQARPEGAWIASGDLRFAARPTANTPTEPLFLSSADVSGPGKAPVLVVLSDTKSAGPETWPGLLAAMAAGRIGVVNRSVYAGHLALGPPGDSAIARFDRDVLGTAGATHALIFAGNNDLIQPGMRNAQGRFAIDPSLALSVEQLTGLLAQCTQRARNAGLAAVGGTWLPYEGVTVAQGYSTPEKMAQREVINAWIRSSETFNLVVDFDRALRDPERPARLAPDFDEGNHFTPNARGYARMATEVLAVITA